MCNSQRLSCRRASVQNRRPRVSRHLGWPASGGSCQGVQCHTRSYSIMRPPEQFDSESPRCCGPPRFARSLTFCGSDQSRTQCRGLSRASRTPLSSARSDRLLLANRSHSSVVCAKTTSRDRRALVRRHAQYASSAPGKTSLQTFFFSTPFSITACRPYLPSALSTVR